MRYFIKTFGCQMNKSDSERIVGLFKCLNFQEAKSMQTADVIVINTCMIRQTAEDRVYGLIKQTDKLKRRKKKLKVVLTGCAAVKKDVQKRLGERIDVYLDIRDLHQLPEMLGIGEVVKVKDYFHIKPKTENKITAYIPIMTGCNNYCSYCVVPYVRGSEYSRKPDDVIKEVKKFVKDGYKEIILLGQNVNSYKYGFPELLEKINNIPGDFWIRFVSSHPKDFSVKLIKAIKKLDKVTEYVHLPIQAGDDNVLKLMNRKYTVKDYIKIIERVKKEIPEATISTDTIVGFPGETKKTFENTLKVYKNLKFDMSYVSRYSPRQGTAAYELEDSVSKTEKEKRESQLLKVLEKGILENNKKLVGKDELVLVHDYKKGLCVGKDRGFRTIKFKGSKKLLGRFVCVKLEVPKEYGLVGTGLDLSLPNLQCGVDNSVCKQIGLPKVIVIVGPNAAGKTSMSIKMAKEFNGEIISADSRQVYKYMNIGSGKVTKSEMQGIKHYLLDVFHPSRRFTVVDFQKKGKEAIEKILKKGKIPIICGGTGFYVKALVDNLQFPDAKPNLSLRKKLEKEPLENLYKKLEKKDPTRAASIDPKNKRKIIRALEMNDTLKGNVPKLEPEKIYDSLWFGVKREKEELDKLIHIRLLERMKQGMLAEVKRIKRLGVSWKRLEDLGLEYRYLAYYLQGKMSKQEMLEKLESEIKAFAKRQRTWFAKEDRINWVKNFDQTKNKVAHFLGLDKN